MKTQHICIKGTALGPFLQRQAPSSSYSPRRRNVVPHLLWVVLLVLLALANNVAAQEVDAQTSGSPVHAPVGIVPTADAASQFLNSGSGELGPSNNNGIQYHNGPVLVGPHNVYFIWYGHWGWSPALQILPNFISSLNGSSYLNSDTSYSQSDGQSVLNTVYMGNQVSDGYSRGKNLTDTDIEIIVENQLTSHGLPSDANGIYFVFTSADVTETDGQGHYFCGTNKNDYCGWHHHATMSGYDIKFAFVGDPDQCGANCWERNPSPNGNAAADAMTDSIAHELNETLTDPDATAWYRDSDGFEIGDICSGQFGSTFLAPNGATANVTLGGNYYLIQQNWLNAGGGSCVMSFAGALSGDVDTILNHEEQYYVGFDEHVHQLWWDGNWHTTDITTDTGAPNAAPGTPLASQVDTITHTIETYFIGVDQHVYEMWWNNGWQYRTDVTTESGAPLAAVGSPLVCQIDTITNNPEVYFLGANQHVYELWWRGRWFSVDVTWEAGAPNAMPGGNLVSMIDPLVNAPEVYYIGTDQHIHQLLWNGRWQTADLSGGFAPNAMIGSPLTGTSKGGAPNLYYVGSNQHVYNLDETVILHTITWTQGDITLAANAPLVAVNSPLVSQYDSVTKDSEVYFLDSNQHVNELWFNGRWATTDVTHEASAPPAAFGSPLTAQVDTITGNPEVYYIGTDQIVYELWWRSRWSFSKASPAGAPQAIP